ncbi:DUF4822 domain-containing protein [Acinetobacter gerneri]|uniref:DUF4822 domain-containing protein n=1 Tax=Acinetobacter gerneri TaxID=202952 RepID=UPI003A8372AF
MKFFKSIAMVSILVLPLLNACTYLKPNNVVEVPNLTPKVLLAATPWLTTEAKDQNAQAVALDDARATNYVGYAYFKKDGSFKMYNLDDSLKMQGTWSVSDDGKTRTINAYDGNGKLLFTRVVEIVTLNSQEFSYRVAGQNGQYTDIIHKPTDHAEPKS